MLRLQASCVLGVLTLLASCRNAPDAPLAINAAPAVRAIVTPQVARVLAGDGLFQTPEATEDGHGVISAAAAQELAVGYMRLFGPYIRSHIESLHGSPVNFTQVTAGRALLAESPYSSDLPYRSRPERKLYGSYYVVVVKTAAGPFATVAVSAYASDVHFTEKGFAADGQYGNEFRTWVIPAKPGGAVVGEPRFTPEQAVNVAFDAVRTPIAAAPRFVRTGGDFVPQIGRWQLRLAGPVSVRDLGTGAIVRTSELYLNREGTFEIPSLAQRNTSRRPFMRQLGDSVKLKPDLPITFVRVAVESQTRGGGQ